MPGVIYSDTYKEACFQAWYGAGRPSQVSKTLEVIPEIEGHKPSAPMVKRWMNETWTLRADELDAKAIELADDHLIVQKAEMLKAQAQRGEELQKAGMEHLKNKGFDSSSAAVSAVIRGADLERTSRGIGELIVKMSKMTESELHKEIMNRIEILQGDMVIDAEVKEEKEKDDKDDTESE